MISSFIDLKFVSDWKCFFKPFNKLCLMILNLLPVTRNSEILSLDFNKIDFTLQLFNEIGWIVQKKNLIDTKNRPLEISSCAM